MPGLQTQKTASAPASGWETKHFVAAGVFAAITFALAFILGSGLILATGIPATGGIANIFVAVLLLIIGIQIVPRFGFATLVLGLMFTFAIPTVIGGPPGAQKILNGVAIGLTADIVLMLSKRTRWGHIVAGSAGAMVSIISIFAVLVLFKLPGVEKLRPLLIPLTAVQGIMGALAGWAGVSLFEKRLSKLAAVKRLMAPPSAPPEA